MARRDPRWIRGVDLFNAGEFFDSHEAVEEVWLEEAGGEREFLKGFIQCAVALEHHRRGNPRGFRSVAETAVLHLGRSAPDAGGLDVARLVGEFESFRSAVERGADAPWPRARWRDADPREGEEAGT